MAEPLDLAELDPGIRDIVARLRAAGFETTDSGDGRSKEPGPDILPFGHVAIASTPAGLIADAWNVLVYMTLYEPAGFQVQGTYDPDDGTAVVLVTWPGPL